MSKLSEQVEDAQRKLHETILQALRKFTAETGLPVESAYWNVVTAEAGKSGTVAVDYYGMSTRFQSSVC